MSDDGKTFTFKMNPNAKFASGNPVTAYDAEYSLQRVINLDSRISFILTQFGLTKDNVAERIKATDDSTLVFEVDQKYAQSFVLYVLSSYTGGIVDSKIVKEHEGKREDGSNDYGNAWLKAENSAGSGPFVLTKWDPKSFDPDDPQRQLLGHAPGRRAHLPPAHAGERDRAPGTREGRHRHRQQARPGRYRRGRRPTPTSSIMEGNSSTIYYFGLNVRNPALSNPKVVEAMKYLVDYKGIADSIGRGTIKVHQTMIPDGFLGGGIDYNPYSLDVEKAKALIAESGVATPIKLQTVVWNVPPYPDYAQAVQSTMAQAGIDLDLQVVDGGPWLDRYRSHDLDIWFGLWGPDYPDPHSNAKALRLQRCERSGRQEGQPRRPFRLGLGQDLRRGDGGRAGAGYAEAQGDVRHHPARAHRLLAVRLHVPGQPQGCHAFERQGCRARHHLLGRPLWRREQGINHPSGPGLRLRSRFSRGG